VRSVGIGYILWALFGLLGVHRFYCGKIGTGILWFFTGGVLGVGWLVDAFLIPGMVYEANLREPPLFGPPTPAWGGAPYAYGPPPVPGQVPAGAFVGAPANRVIYCTQCGAPMRVPVNASGRHYACPGCRTILEVPA